MKDLTVADIFRAQDLSSIGINTISGYYKHIRKLVDSGEVEADVKHLFNGIKIFIKEEDWKNYITKTV